MAPTFHLAEPTRNTSPLPSSNSPKSTTKCYSRASFVAYSDICITRKTPAFLHRRQDDKFHSRLLSRENSSANPSLRVYYGVAAGAVPFLSESEPGTPKNIVPDGTLPPLSPPPSYFSSPGNREPKKSPKPTLIRAVLPKLILRKLQRPSSSSMTLLSLSESPISTSSPKASPAGDASPTSFFCFMARQGATCGLKGAATR